LWTLARVLASAMLEWVPSGQPVLLGVDDHLIQHGGRRVYGRGRHRSSVGSTRGILCWGHRWVILVVIVRLPFASRDWALPVLCALYRDRKTGEQEHRRHKTPCDLTRQLVGILMHGFPDRRFILLGDGGYASHQLAGFARRHRDRLTLIARGRPDLNLRVLPGPHTFSRQALWKRRKYNRRPRCRRGRKLPSPQQSVAAARTGGSLPTQNLQWYGQSHKIMQIVSAAGGWYHAYGNGAAALLPVRWVYTHDPEQPDYHDWFFCTDPTMTPASIVQRFARRWAIEVTFQELHVHMGVHTTRQRCRQSILRTTPWLLGLFSGVCLVFNTLPRARQKVLHHTPCYEKSEVTFADALYAVRRSLWECCLLKRAIGNAIVTKLPQATQHKLIAYLAEAA
jgi:hypothetical protein